jgi:hypothetical protein
VLSVSILDSSLLETHCSANHKNFVTHLLIIFILINKPLYVEHSSSFSVNNTHTKMLLDISTWTSRIFDQELVLLVIDCSSTPTLTVGQGKIPLYKTIHCMPVSAAFYSLRGTVLHDLQCLQWALLTRGSSVLLVSFFDSSLLETHCSATMRILLHTC